MNGAALKRRMMITVTIIVAVVGFLLFVMKTMPFANHKEGIAGSGMKTSVDGTIPTDKIARGEISHGIQKIENTLERSGFSPAILVLERNRKTIWVIQVKNINPPMNRIVFPADNSSLTLKKGRNEYCFTPVKNFIYRSGGNRFNGYGKVVADIHVVDNGAIRKEAANIRLPKGAGSCCWVR